MKRVLVLWVVVALGTSMVFAENATTFPAAGVHVAMNARYALDEKVPEINVEGVAISRVIEFLRETSGANLVVDWRTLEDAGVGRDAPVTLQVRGLTLRKLLQLALDQASPNTPLVAGVDQNVIEVTSQEAADRKLVTRTYSVADLVLPQVTTKPPSLDLAQASQQGSSGGGGGSGLIKDDNASGQGNMTQQQMGDQLAALVRTMVRPTIWQENGGPASVSYFMGQLIVTAPVSVQEAIGGAEESSGERFGF